MTAARIGAGPEELLDLARMRENRKRDEMIGARAARRCEAFERARAALAESVRELEAAGAVGEPGDMPAPVLDRARLLLSVDGSGDQDGLLRDCLEYLSTALSEDFAQGSDRCLRLRLAARLGVDPEGIAL